VGDGEDKERVQFRFAPREVDLLAISWVSVGVRLGPGGKLMLRSPKLQKRASDTEGPKMGFPKLQPDKFFWI